MDNFKYIRLTVTILSVFHLDMSQTRISKIVLGLNERLEQFGLCDIRITAEFESTDFERFQVPVALIDVELRSNYSFFHQIWYLNVSIPYLRRPKIRFPFKHRKETCMIDLILLLDNKDGSGYIATEHIRLVAENYLVLIRNHQIPMIKDTYSLVNNRRYLDYRIFIWTVTPELRRIDIGLVYAFSFKNILFVCDPSQGELHQNPNAHIESSLYKLEQQENSLR